MNCTKCGTNVVDMVSLLAHYNESHRDTTAASYSAVVSAREAAAARRSPPPVDDVEDVPMVQPPLEPK